LISDKYADANKVKYRAENDGVLFRECGALRIQSRALAWTVEGGDSGSHNRGYSERRNPGENGFGQQPVKACPFIPYATSPARRIALTKSDISRPAYARDATESALPAGGGPAIIDQYSNGFFDGVV